MTGVHSIDMTPTSSPSAAIAVVAGARSADLEDFASAAVLRLREDLALALRAAAHHASPKASATTSASSFPTAPGASC